MSARALYEGRWIVLGLLFVWAVLLGLQPWLALLPAAGVFFTFYFFRDPERVGSSAPEAILAPADGLVTDVEEVAETPGIGRGKRVSIFLSIFDVHVNRMPVAGQVLESEFRKGKFLDARNPASHRENQSMTWLIEETGTERRVVVRQITGAVARRIVAWARIGDILKKGERFGMIRFGSRTDLFLPMEVEVVVSPGMKVRGGETVVARWQEKP